MQLAVIILILCACIAYVAYLLRQRFTKTRQDEDVRCAGCPLADSCQKQKTQQAETCEKDTKKKGCCC